jgi:quercetin dioxygenase-like cupin family protein
LWPKSDDVERAAPSRVARIGMVRAGLTARRAGWEDRDAMPDDARQPFALTPGEGLAIENPVGDVLTFKATAETSCGALTAVETIASPGEGPPLHVHRDHEETIYTLDGHFRVQLADVLVDASPGSFVFIPRGTAHTWQNVGDAPGRLLATIMPADRNFELLFLRYSQLPRSERGTQAFVRLARETYAFEVIGPPLADPARG